MTKGKNVHVTPHQGDWSVKTEGSKRASSVHKTQKEALVAAKPIATHNKSELVTHRKDGTIRDKDSYGNDPCPPKDK